MDGPSGDEEESEAKRPRSTSTTPKSGRAFDPDEYDRLMGVSPAGGSCQHRGAALGLRACARCKGPDQNEEQDDVV